MFFWDKEGIFAGWIGIWGDWAAHNAYASRFAYQDPADWIETHPLYIGTKFTYPFLSNLISGLIIWLGLDRVSAFIYPTILFTILFLCLLYKFYFIQLKSFKKAILGVFVFLTSGGLGFLWFLRDLKTDFWNNLFFPPDQYTQLKEGTIYWLNTVTGQLVPQRSLLIGMVIGLFVIIMLYKYVKLRDTSRKYLKMFVLGLLTSSLVLAHMHTFIVVFVLSAIIFFFNVKNWKLLLVYGLATAIPALCFYTILYGGAIQTSFFSWHPGWLANEKSKNMNFVYFWIINWGFFLILSIWGFVQKKGYKNEFVVAGLVLFVIANLFLFQPFDWDNSKILTWVYLFWTIPVVQIIAFCWNRKMIFMKLLAIIFVVLVSLSGFVDIYRLTKVDKLKILMFSNDDIKLAAEFRQISDPDSIVLTSDKHNHFIPTLTGRQILLGYRGWMWTYGIKDAEVYSDMQSMFSGDERAQSLINKYGIDYVVIGYDERANYKANEQYFKSRYQMVLSNNSYNIYKID